MRPVPAQLVVLAKEPLPGRAKTRLVPALGPDRAAAVALAALTDTLATVAQVPVVRRTVVLDGAPGAWLPAGTAVLPQSGGDLGERLSAAYADAWAALPLPVLLVGMDTPQLTADLLGSALEALLSPDTDAVLGPADDGGWWALGLRRPAPGLFDGVPMSTAGTGAAQLARLDAFGLVTRALPPLRDIDHVEDIGPVAALQPRGARLAVLAGELGLVPA